MQPKIAIRLVDRGALCGLTIFEDDTIAIEDEKAYVEIGADGMTLQQCWKEEPKGAHFDAICACEDAIQVPRRQHDDSCSPFEALCFALTRRPEVIIDCPPLSAFLKIAVEASGEDLKEAEDLLVTSHQKEETNGNEGTAAAAGPS